MRVSRWLIPALLLLPLAAGADDLDRSVPAGVHDTLRIELERGDVDVITYDADEVRLEARARGLGASAVHFRLRQDGRRLVLEGRAEKWLRWLGVGPRVSVRAWVPRRLVVDVETPGAVVASDGGVAVSRPARRATAPAPQDR